MYALVLWVTIIFSYLLIRGIVVNPTHRDIFLDVIGLIFVLFVAFMAFSVFAINYFYFDTETNELCSKAGFGLMERYKFKYVVSVQRKRKLFVTSALAVDVLELVIERDKKEGKLVVYASPKDEEGFLAMIKQNCRNVKFIDIKK